MTKLFTISDLKAHWGITEYRVERMIAKGILDAPLPRTSESETRLWSSAQVKRAEERIRRLSRPKPQPVTPTMRPLSEKMKAKIRASKQPERGDVLRGGRFL